MNALYREIPLKDATFRLLRKYFNAMANLYGIIPLRKAKEIIFSLSPKLVTAEEFFALHNAFHNTTRMPCNRGYTPEELMQITPPAERFQSVSLGPNIRRGLQTGEIDVEDLRKQILTATLPNEGARFDLLRQLAGVTSSAPKPEKAKKIGRNTPCPCGSGKKYKQCCGR